MEKIITEELNFIDEEGRVRIFNGMNIDDKLIGSTFRYNLDDEFFTKYVSHGFNLIRLAVQWANLEPEPEHYSESYLASIDNIFRLAEKYGVYILIDMHQDLFSGFDGAGDGDGAPQWACLMDGHEAKPCKLVWAEAYVFGKWVHSCFDHFWVNDKVAGRGLQDRYADLWKMLAERYGNSPALFGFDLMNEPAPGSYSKKLFGRLATAGIFQVFTNNKIRKADIVRALIGKDYKKLLDSIPGSVVRDIVGKIDDISAKFDKEYYSPFLNKIASSIREKTQNGIIVIEQQFLCNGGVKLAVPPITVNGEREKLQCFCPHSYDMTVDTPLYKYANADRVKAFFNEMRISQLKLNVPVVVGEWGGCSDNRDTSWFPHANELLDYFDTNCWGQLYWDYHGDDMDSPLMDMLCRTYPVAVAGRNPHYFRSEDKKTFTLTYESDKEGTTLIYVHTDCKAETDCEISVIEEYPEGASLMGITGGKGKHYVVLRCE